MSGHEYKVGDRVEVVRRGDVDDGHVGEVVRVGSSKMLQVHLGVFLKERWFEPNDLKLLEPSAAPDEPDLVKSPPHYSLGTPDGIEAIDIIRAHMKAGGTWETANALKYILRFPFKGNATQDVAKAVEYLTIWTNEQVSA